jgi:hypothetical protein
MELANAEKKNKKKMWIFNIEFFNILILKMTIQSLFFQNVFPSFVDPFTSFFTVPYFCEVFLMSTNAFDICNKLSTRLSKKIIALSYYYKFLT